MAQNSAADVPAHLHTAQFSELPEENGDDVGYSQGYPSDNKDGWFQVEYATGSDYSGSSCHRSNYRVLAKMLREEHSDGPVVWARTSGGHGTYGIAVRYSELNDGVRAAIDACEDYPIIDDNDHSGLELDEQSEAWDSWARGDFLRELAKALDKDRDALTDVLESQGWWHVFDAMAEASNTYWEDQGGEGPYIDLKRIVKQLVTHIQEGSFPKYSHETQDAALEVLYEALPSIDAA